MVFRKGHVGYKFWLGKKCPEESKRMIGNNYALGRSAWNKGFTKETDERIREGAKLQSISMLGNKNALGHGAPTGGGNPNYIDGRKKNPENGYRGEDWDQAREEALKDADNKCFFSELENCRGKLCVHHIDNYIDSRNNSQDNLIVLCDKHHVKFEQRWMGRGYHTNV